MAATGNEVCCTAGRPLEQANTQHRQEGKGSSGGKGTFVLKSGILIASLRTFCYVTPVAHKCCGARLRKRLLQKEIVEPEAEGNNFVYYLAGAVLFGGVIWGFKGFQAAEEYYAGYLLEQSLSVDNLFVFMLCFSFFKTPQELQGRVLSIGVWSAAVLRLVMILAGVQLVENFKPLLLVFAGILLYSSYGLLFGDDDEEEEDLSQNAIVKTINKV